LSRNGVIDEEKLSTETLLQIFKPLKDRVEQSIKKQESLMAEVQISNEKFTKERHGSNLGERDNLLKLLATGFDAFFELQNSLDEGHKFYSDLTPILIRVQQKVTDFCYARQTEKEDLMKQVQQNIVSGGTGSNKMPPPRPPPPSANVNAPIPPPQYLSQYQAAPAQQLQTTPIGQNQQSGQQPYQPPNPYIPYQTQPVYQYGVPPQGQGQGFQYGAPPQGQGYAIPPYPVQYPGTYPGAYPQQQYGAYPPQQQQNTNNPFQ